MSFYIKINDAAKASLFTSFYLIAAYISLYQVNKLRRIEIYTLRSKKISVNLRGIDIR